MPAGSGGAGRAGLGGDEAGGAPPTDDGGAGSGESPSECPCSAPTPTCQDDQCVVRGPSMIKAGGFYVDSTEVTIADYAAFLRAAKDPSAVEQAPACAWNLSFDAVRGAEVADEPTTHPVTGIDWCDAAAYCAWAGKRLCGKIGGGSVSFAELADPAKGQWFAACGGPNGQQYPYGTSHDDGACNDASSGTGKAASVGVFAKCHGFHAGLFDMLGNVTEWVDACDASLGPIDGCQTIGGSFATNPTCSTSGLRRRNDTSPGVGFRCCSE